MKLFHWPNSKALELYGAGDIIVMANSIEEARAAALEQARQATIGYTEMVATQHWIEQYPDDCDDEKGRIATAISLLEADLAKGPIEFEGPKAIFINGSE